MSLRATNDSMKLLCGKEDSAFGAQLWEPRERVDKYPQTSWRVWCSQVSQPHNALQPLRLRPHSATRIALLQNKMDYFTTASPWCLRHVIGISLFVGVTNMCNRMGVGDSGSSFRFLENLGPSAQEKFNHVRSSNMASWEQNILKMPHVYIQKSMFCYRTEYSALHRRCHAGPEHHVPAEISG